MKELNVELQFVLEGLGVLSESLETIYKRLEKASLEEKPTAKPKSMVADGLKANAIPTNKIKAAAKVTAADTAQAVNKKPRKAVNENTLKIGDLSPFWQ